jgi:hypothetical protein
VYLALQVKHSEKHILKKSADSIIRNFVSILSCSLAGTPDYVNVSQFVLDTGVKGIVSQDWKGLQMVSLDRFEV